MSTTKTLELIFTTEENKSSTISIDNPKEPIDMEVVNSAMDIIIAEAALYTTSGKYVAKKGARMVERTVQSFTL